MQANLGAQNHAVVLEDAEPDATLKAPAQPQPSRIAPTLTLTSTLTLAPSPDATLTPTLALTLTLLEAFNLCSPTPLRRPPLTPTPNAPLKALVAAGFGAAGQRCMAISRVVLVGRAREASDFFSQQYISINVPCDRRACSPEQQYR